MLSAVGAFLFLVVSVPCALSDGNFVIEEVFVKPGGVARSASIKGFGVECKFDYTCQGGTGEEWHFTMVRLGELNRYACHIQRPSESSSYLYFQKFALSIIGPAKLTTGVAYADHTTKLSKDEYTLDYNKKSLSQIDGRFGGHLVHASLEFEKGAEQTEL
ncbi:hypothetical protein Aperf_G00000078875 [Anoplocephala perfoliata]